MSIDLLKFATDELEKIGFIDDADLLDSKIIG